MVSRLVFESVVSQIIKKKKFLIFLLGMNFEILGGMFLLYTPYSYLQSSKKKKKLIVMLLIKCLNIKFL